MSSNLLYLVCVFLVCKYVFASWSLFSDTEDLSNGGDLDDLSEPDNFDNLSPALFVDWNHPEIASVADHPEISLSDDLFSADISSSCLNDDAALPSKLKARDPFCSMPDVPVSVPQFPNLLNSIEEQDSPRPTVLDNQGDLTTTKSAEYFCAAEKYRVNIGIGRMLVPVCGSGNMILALPPQQGWPGYGVTGYYPNVEFSRPSKVNRPFLQTSSNLAPID